MKFPSLPQLPVDKANHAFYGGVLALIGFTLSGLDLAIALSVGLAALKELVDWMGRKGTPEWLDAIATIAGAALVILSHWRSW